MSGRFQPGNKGGGKRKEKLMYDALMVALKRTDESNTPAFTRIAQKLVELGLSGDMQAIKEINNRIDGMPIVQIDQTIENVTYVAELPAVAENADEWLKINAPDSQTTPPIQ